MAGVFFLFAFSLSLFLSLLLLLADEVNHLLESFVVLAEVVAGSTAWLGRGLSCVCAQRRESDTRPSFDLTPSQEECLQRLQNRIDIAYDSSIPEHQEALRALWNAAFPEEELRGLISEQWKEMGWQGKDPSTDFRGGGFISLENLLFFARNFPKSFQDLLWKQEGDRSVWEYPFAVAGVNITFMLIQMLDLEAVNSVLQFYSQTKDNYWSNFLKVPIRK
ncbi:ELMO domain-containing protein A-like isoform X6 [Durio zibethinus]|uniref:ELMO domain-containing protein A-like isoform X6 n=1 Tax=Durio zibethinus TaxID=66656 RepID=A0A6P5ZVT5_DURZI|nr:ELMO domain-containing protein A-like isoform X6 [Durio zibethinus]